VRVRDLNWLQPLPDEGVLRVWATGVEETRELLDHGWRS
jgi:hypothetical protein